MSTKIYVDLVTLDINIVHYRRPRAQVKARKPRPPLRCYARLVIICARLCKQSLDNLAQARGEYESVMQVLDEYGARLSWGGLVFSPADYRATKQQCLNVGARKLLQQDPATRTEQDINVLLVALRNIPAFAEYPKKMQRQLCRVGGFETFEPRRVVLREGDPPSSFYFILSGAVLVTSFDEKSGTSRTLVQLDKGMSFGELAVISNTKRQATVCSKTEVELLSISGEEFQDIFMAGGKNIMANAKQQEFIRSVGFLRYWPLDKLRGDSSTCSVYYFDRNQILVRDSNNSDWIYVVLKGSLSVIKKLRRVEPKNELLTPRKRCRLSFREPKHHFMRKNVPPGDKHRRHRYSSNDILDDYPDENGSSFSAMRRRFSADLETYKSAFEVESKLESTLPGYHNTVERLGSLNYEKIIRDHRSRLQLKGSHTDGRRSYVTGTQSRDVSRQSVTSEIASPLPITNVEVARTENQNDGAAGTESEDKISSPRRSFLPHISNNNKVVQQETSLSHDQRRSRENVDVKVDGNTDGDADDERVSPMPEGEYESRRQHRKRKRISKTQKGVYLAPSQHSGTGKEVGESSPELQSLTTSPGPETEQSHHTELLSRNLMNNDREEETPVDGAGKKEESISEKLAKLQIQYQRRIMDREGRKTIAEELDQRGRRDFKFTEVDLDPTVIELQVLEKGQYFGVTPLLFPDQPSLSIVSNGAECLVLSKRLFMQFASEKCLRHLRQTESPYPGDVELSRKLQEVVNWHHGRAVVYRKLESEVRQKQILRKQFLPSYQGQYCFRTGPT